MGRKQEGTFVSATRIFPYELNEGGTFMVRVEGDIFELSLKNAKCIRTIRHVAIVVNVVINEIGLILRRHHR